MSQEQFTLESACPGIALHSFCENVVWDIL